MTITTKQIRKGEVGGEFIVFLLLGGHGKPKNACLMEYFVVVVVVVVVIVDVIVVIVIIICCCCCG